MQQHNIAPHPDDWNYEIKMKWYEEENSETEIQEIKNKKMERTKYQSLSERDRRLFICELSHVCATDDKYFDLFSEIINKAKEDGKFENVKILTGINDFDTEK